MNLNFAVAVVLAFIVLLFGVAAWVEARGQALTARPRLRHAAYTLALGVYCTSWTFYGAVGSAARDGWSYLPIYAAPILLLLLAPGFLRALAEAVAEEKATTVSDFIAARFGNDVVVARLVTVIALLGTIPYVALQFRSIGTALALVSGQDVTPPVIVVAAGVLALFAILFGARRFELSGRSEGLLFAIALESLIKLLSLIAVAGLAWSVIANAPQDAVAQGALRLQGRFLPERLSIEVAVISLISATAILALPRQFYMGLVEARDPSDLQRARFGFAAYLAVMAAVVIPIALAGMVALPASAGPDSYVLALPLMADVSPLIIAALLGGVAAAASMAIVDSTALATMVSNDLIFPTIVRTGGEAESGELGRRMLLVRRVSVVAIMALALLWALAVSPRNSLASIGLIAFAGIAQFTPHLVMAVWRRGLDPLAARASLIAGLVLWVYTLALPPVIPQRLVAALSGSLADPLRLFGIGNATPLVHGVFWSLGLNLLVLGLVNARKVRGGPLPRLVFTGRQVSDLGDLVQLTASFIGRERAEAEFPGARRGQPVDRKAAQRAQELIARVVGTASARSLVASSLAGGTMSLQDVTRLLDAGSQSLRFSRQLLAATFENIDAGISVVDAEMNLVAWNSRYLDLFDYPPGMVRVGAPIADLIHHNAQHGDFGPGEAEHHVEKRLGHLRRGLEHSFERHRADGRVIKTVGGPMPGGGYVMSFTDITEEARVREELRETLEQLEARVAERTEELSGANRRLAKADRDKTRFLAAASHDLLQPLHAARLFTAALERDAADSQRSLVGRVDSAIVAAEDLLRALLDISRLDAGGVTPTPEPIALKDFIADLAETIRPMAEEKGLAMRIGPLPGFVNTDPGLLRSVMQNFLSNAVRYTQTGGVLVGTKRRGQWWRIDVIDSGIGIEEAHHEAIFNEFIRLGQVEVDGIGLGLALVERITRLLGGKLEMRSIPGKGSRFSLLMPVHHGAPPSAGRASAAAPLDGRSLDLLVVDNDPLIVEATAALLVGMGHQVRSAATIADALAHAPAIDAALVDFQLDHGEDGLTLIAALRSRRPGLPAVLITAENGAAMQARASALQVPILSKPVDPAAIGAFLARVSVREVEA